MAYKAPKGTKDVTPEESYRWQYLEHTIRRIVRKYGLLEARTPCIEHTELFLRGVGDTTDIVQKEMYTFTDKGDRSITLKPEGTAGDVPAIHQLNLIKKYIQFLILRDPCFDVGNQSLGIRYFQRILHQLKIQAENSLSLRLHFFCNL